MLQGQYSLPNLIKEFYNNEKAIYAYLKGEKQENFEANNDIYIPLITGWPSNDSTLPPIDITTINAGANILGFGIGFFLVLFLVSLVIWVWALYVLIKFWNNISDIVKIVGIIALLTGVGGPILTLILVYATKTVQPVTPISSEVLAKTSVLTLPVTVTDVASKNILPKKKSKNRK